MSITDMIVRLLCVVAVAVAIGAAVVVAYSWLSLGVFLSWMTLFTVVGVIVLYNSIHILKPGQMIAFYLLGAKWIGTVVTDAYYNENREEILRVDGSDKVRIALFGGVAFGLWPFVWGYRLPTTTFEIPISASSMYTRTGKPGEETLPRIRLRGDGTLQIRLHPVVKRLPGTLPILTQRVANLAEIVPLEDVPPGPDGEVLKGPAIANLINGVVKKPMLQAMRTAASEFTWGSEGDEKGRDRDIVNCRDDYEWAVQRVLLQPGSVFLTAGFLQEPGEAIRNDLEGWPEYRAEKGDSLMELDVVVELIKPEPIPENASELEKAIDMAYIGFQEGARERAKERLRLIGQAEGFKKMADELGVTEERIQLVLLEAIRQGKIEVTAIGGSGAEGLLGLLDGLIRKTRAGTSGAPPTA